MELKNRSKNTLRLIDFSLGKAEDHFKKPLESLSIEELKKYFEGLKKRGNNTKEKGNSINTIDLTQKKFMQFYEWCFNETDDAKYATLARKINRIKSDKVKKEIKPDKILLPEEIKKLINVATIERDRCIVAVLYESGIRIGEFLSLKNDMVQMDELKQEVTFHIPSEPGCKTGSRSVTCLEIYGYVQDWLKCNPDKQFMPLSQNGVRRAIKLLFDKAGINKPYNIHHFRHSAITHAAGLNMSETQLSYRFWGIPHSAMLSVYIHLNEQLKSSGYRDAKGMGENSNGKTIINPLASRCVECGRLIQAGSLCKTCTDSKKMKEENSELKTQMADMQAKQQEQTDFILRVMKEKGIL
ncbi:MAG: tyrosine-type recombinase/integrase [Candidatus Methanoperedens sp.]|nr:tyrosine-type recombinase/integrase [Candidatus Methanoperedens sp.]